MQGFELYAMFRKEQDLVESMSWGRARWENLRSVERQVWDNLASRVQPVDLTDREIGAATSGEKP